MLCLGELKYENTKYSFWEKLGLKYSNATSTKNVNELNVSWRKLLKYKNYHSKLQYVLIVVLQELI